MEVSDNEIKGLLKKILEIEREHQFDTNKNRERLVKSAIEKFLKEREEVK